jgi:hypothetical protein
MLNTSIEEVAVGAVASSGQGSGSTKMMQRLATAPAPQHRLHDVSALTFEKFYSFVTLSMSKKLNAAHLS